MKKLLLFLALIIGGGITNCLSAQSTTPTYDFQFVAANCSKGTSGYTGVSTNYFITSDKTGNSVTVQNGNNNNLQWNYVKIGGKNGAYTGTISSNFAVEQSIEKIEMTVDAITTASVNSIYLQCAPSQAALSSAEQIKVTPALGTLTWTPAANEGSYFKITVDCAKASSNGVVSISGIKIYTTSGDTPNPGKATFNSLPTNLTLGVEEVRDLLGDTHPTEIIFVSNDEDVAMVDDDGTVMGVAPGSTTIEVAWDEDDTFLAGEANINVTVSKKQPGISFPESTYTLNIGETMVSPLVNPNNLPISWHIANEQIATVDTDGTVTALAVGETTVRATFTANDTYAGTWKEYTLFVRDPSAVEVETIVDELSYANFGITSQTYSSKEYTGESGVKYIAYVNQQTKHANDDVNPFGIRMNSDTSKNDFIAVAESDRHIKNIAVKPSFGLTTGRSMKIYGRSKPFESANGTIPDDAVLVTTISLTAGTEATYDFTADYKYIAITSGGTNAIALLYIRLGWEKTAGPELEDPGLAFAGDADNYRVSIDEKDSFVAPELSNPNNLEVTWTSSKPEVATVDSDGNLTILATGITVITATTAATDKYSAGEAFYTITVFNPNLLETTFDFVNETYGMTRSSTAYLALPTTFSNSDKTIYATLYKTDGLGWRLIENGGLRPYKGTVSITFTPIHGYAITKISFDAADETGYQNVVWIGESVSETISAEPSANKDISSIKVEYAPVESSLTENDVMLDFRNPGSLHELTTDGDGHGSVVPFTLPDDNTVTGHALTTPMANFTLTISEGDSQQPTVGEHLAAHPGCTLTFRSHTPAGANSPNPIMSISINGRELHNLAFASHTLHNAGGIAPMTVATSDYTEVNDPHTSHTYTAPSQGATLVSMTVAESPAEIHNVIVSTRDGQTTSIETIDTDSNACGAEYYNLQGIRVANPAPGALYIVRRGATTAKEVK